MDTTTPTPVEIMKLTLAGGIWGNNLTLTISPGSNSGQKVTIMNGSEILQQWDNCADATAIYNNILARNSIPVEITVGDLTKTPATVTAQAFTGGAEVSEPSASDIDSALATLLNEQFDLLIFTDLPIDTYYANIDTYIQSKLSADQLCMAVLPIDVTKTNADVIELLTSIDDQFFMWLTQSVTSGTEILNEAATAARIAGYLAGLPVNTSMTNKTISDITAINEDYGTLDDGGATQYQLTDNGATLLTVKDRQNQIYGIVSAVTGSHFVDDTGQKPYVESHAMRTLCFCCNYLNVNDMLGSTDFTTTQLAVNAEIEQRISDLEGVVADDIQYSTEFDEDNNEVLYEDISVQPFGILKHIHQRITMVNPTVTGS